MLGTIFVAGVGTLAFKLGMDAGRMKHEGKSTSDIMKSLPGEAINTVSYAACSTYNAVRNLFGCKCKDDNQQKTS